MTDPASAPADKTSPTKWLWLAAIVLLAVAAVIMFLNPDGDESDFPITDAAVTTPEERMNTDLGTDMDAEAAAEQINGIDSAAEARNPGS